MTIQRATVIGVFSDRSRAQAAVQDLRQAGFRDDQIGIVSRSDTATGAVSHGQYKERTGPGGDATNTHWEEGLGVGAAAGAATGVGLGLAVAAGLIPGIGPVILGGTLAAILASAGTGAAAGAVIGGL
ncbi:MAG TPA: general stress protein, partial [Gemmataceae bacterium]|nr:general stress protein [Gemmataceae bacterium]